MSIIDIKNSIVPPRKETLSANVARQLKSLILSQKFKTGDRLPAERKLSELFNVSRAVIKQALFALEYAGFIEPKLGAKGGSVVVYDSSKPITVFMKDLHRNGKLKIHHFQQVRKAIELEAIKSAVKDASEKDIQSFTDLNERFIKPENRKQHAELNFQFHLALAKISDNPLIINFLKAIYKLIFSYPGTTISDEFLKVAYEDHLRIIEAIGQRDIIKAKKMLKQNIERVSTEE
ncbi:MAG: FadR family transcriptional regulator [Desulfobacula sp.]|nr:FadR family transcriptional regulator [Desulfobacula sp.]